MIKNKLKAPTFNSGIVKIYSIENVAAPGETPIEKLRLEESLAHGEIKVGIKRYSERAQTEFKVDRLIQCLRRDNITSDMVAVINGGQQYDIGQIQYPDKISPPIMILELSRRSTDYAFI